MEVLLVDAGLAFAALGLVSLVWPLRFLGIRGRGSPPRVAPGGEDASRGALMSSPTASVGEARLPLTFEVPRRQRLLKVGTLVALADPEKQAAARAGTLLIYRSPLRRYKLELNPADAKRCFGALRERCRNAVAIDLTHEDVSSRFAARGNTTRQSGGVGDSDDAQRRGTSREKDPRGPCVGKRGERAAAPVLAGLASGDAVKP
jgi:hypothetical protein